MTSLHCASLLRATHALCSLPITEGDGADKAETPAPCPRASTMKKRAPRADGTSGGGGAGPPPAGTCSSVSEEWASSKSGGSMGDAGAASCPAGLLPALRAQPSPDLLPGHSGTHALHTPGQHRPWLPLCPSCLPSPGRHAAHSPGGPRPQELQLPRRPVAFETQLSLRGQG